MERVGQVRERGDLRQGLEPADERAQESTDAGALVKTVLVPVDGSLLAERAIGVAAGLATSFEADLRLFKASFQLDLREEVAELRSLADRHGLTRAQVEVSTGRSAGPAVIRMSRRTPDSVVVMATHGRSGLAATVLGSVADEILRDLDEPMVIVGPKFEERGEPERIVVCWDGSLLSASVVPTVASWASALRLPVQLVHVRGAGDPPLDGDATSADRTLVDQVKGALAICGRPVEVTEIRADDPACGVLDVLDALRGGALVALATKGRGGLLSSSLGRVSSRIVQGSPHPLLVSHPRT
jgi:nucleotide-binding universal stress UspA family protein